MSKYRKTPLRKWLAENGETISTLARMMNVSRARVHHWVIGAAMPRGRLLLHLLQLTGLELTQLMPNLTIQENRRERERVRRSGEIARIYADVREKQLRTQKRGPHAKSS